MKRYVEMGTFYRDKELLVRTACRAHTPDKNESIICYVEVGEGGEASEVFFMPEASFISRFLNK